MKMKRVLDSVHGYIYIEEDYIRHVVDTEYFQRLRRIEQTSTRSIFPSARHDRFIHSLGVFYLGSKLAENVKSNIEQLPQEQQPENKDCVFESYKIACLLHDVAHAPYSHTFEEFFDNEWSDLKGVLKGLVENEQFCSEWDMVADPSAPHERMSAIVALDTFGEFIKKRRALKELVARMIIGLKYEDKKHSFENAMIDLIHGEVIDADSLDYVCRDAWASGYATTSVDVNRLIDSVRVLLDNKGIFHLCFTSKCLNEIEAVLKVKTFQQSFVINHHTVVYERRLLVKAMESAALYHFYGEKGVKEKEKRVKALKKLCSIDCFYKRDGAFPCIETKHSKIKIALPMDDDFISLMKPVRDDMYVSQWLSRRYILRPLWKSKADFYQLFDHLREVNLTSSSWIFHDDCKKFICSRFDIDEENVIIERATPKYKENYAEKIELYINEEIVKYKTLFPKDVHSYEPPKSEFYYIYIPKEIDRVDVLNLLKKESMKYMFQR